jgi:hypothetical protein
MNDGKRAFMGGPNVCDSRGRYVISKPGGREILAMHALSLFDASTTLLIQ